MNESWTNTPLITHQFRTGSVVICMEMIWLGPHKHLTGPYNIWLGAIWPGAPARYKYFLRSFMWKFFGTKASHCPSLWFPSLSICVIQYPCCCNLYFLFSLPVLFWDGRGHTIRYNIKRVRQVLMRVRCECDKSEWWRICKGFVRVERFMRATFQIIGMENYHWFVTLF